MPAPLHYDLLAIGNALVDVLAHASNTFLEEQSARHGMNRGGMTLIDETRALDLYQSITPEKQAAGGSAANTIAVFAGLGGRGAYQGRTGDDSLRQIFTKSLQDMGVFAKTSTITGDHTGRCMILIDDQAQRTMNTFLGAASGLSPSDLDHDLIASSAITYLEGYLFDRAEAQKAFYDAAKTCRKAGQKLSLTLSDPFCVERHRGAFLDLVHGHVDVLFANEEELRALYHVSSFDDAVRLVRVKCPMAVITRSEKGSVIVTQDETVEIKAAPVSKVVDTTGAGDCYAAGFLYGLSHNLPLAQCGDIASAVAGKVIAQIGPRPDGDLRDIVQSKAA